jgi:hypothetical protein
MTANSAKVHDVQGARDGSKKPYHRPVLQVCGTVKEHTRTGFMGFQVDVTNTTSASQS